MKMLLRILYPVLLSAADQAGGKQAIARAAGEHEPVEEGVVRADLQPVGGGLEDGLLRELSRVVGVALVARDAGFGAAEGELSVVIIAVLAVKCPAPNWIVSPASATSTALLIVVHEPMSRVQVASSPVVVTDTVAARVAAGNATSSASAVSSPNRERRQPRYGTNAANDVRTTTTSTLGESAGPEGPASIERTVRRTG